MAATRRMPAALSEALGVHSGTGMRGLGQVRAGTAALIMEDGFNNKERELSQSW